MLRQPSTEEKKHDDNDDTQNQSRGEYKDSRSVTIPDNGASLDFVTDPPLPVATPDPLGLGTRFALLTSLEKRKFTSALLSFSSEAKKISIIVRTQIEFGLANLVSLQLYISSFATQFEETPANALKNADEVLRQIDEYISQKNTEQKKLLERPLVKIIEENADYAETCLLAEKKYNEEQKPAAESADNQMLSEEKRPTIHSPRYSRMTALLEEAKALQKLQLATLEILINASCSVEEAKREKAQKCAKKSAAEFLKKVRIFEHNVVRFTISDQALREKLLIFAGMLVGTILAASVFGLAPVPIILALVGSALLTKAVVHYYAPACFFKKRPEIAELIDSLKNPVETAKSLHLVR